MKKILFLATIPLTLKAFSLDLMKFLRERGYEVEAAAGGGQEAEERQVGCTENSGTVTGAPSGRQRVGEGMDSGSGDTR